MPCYIGAGAKLETALKGKKWDVVLNNAYQNEALPRVLEIIVHLVSIDVAIPEKDIILRKIIIKIRKIYIIKNDIIINLMVRVGCILSVPKKL